VATRSFALSYTETVFDNKISCCKQIVRQVEIFLKSSLITVHNVVVVYHTVCMHVGGPNNLSDAGTPPPWDGGVSDRLETRCSPTCVIKFSHQMSNHLGVGRGRKNFCGR